MLKNITVSILLNDHWGLKVSEILDVRKCVCALSNVDLFCDGVLVPLNKPLRLVALDTGGLGVKGQSKTQRNRPLKTYLLILQAQQPIGRELLHARKRNLSCASIMNKRATRS